MIVITGGAGFIGSNLINFLFQKKNMSLATVDGKNKKNEDYFSSNKILKIDPKDLDNFLEQNKNKIEIIVHLGAVTSTVENNLDLIIKNNIDLSIFIWNWCTINKKRLVYASSAATYGSGINKFDDNESLKYLSNLFPLNSYGVVEDTGIILPLKYFCPCKEKSNIKSAISFADIGALRPGKASSNISV